MEAVKAARETRFDQREELLRAALRRRYSGQVGEALQEEIIELLRDLLQQDRTRRPELAGDVFDRIEAMSAHRPSVGRTYVRISVEALNELDRHSPEPEVDAGLAVPPTQPLPRSPAPVSVDPTEQPTLGPGATESPIGLTDDLAPTAPSTDRWRQAAIVLAGLLLMALLGLAVQ